MNSLGTEERLEILQFPTELLLDIARGRITRKQMYERSLIFPKSNWCSSFLHDFLWFLWFFVISVIFCDFHDCVISVIFCDFRDFLWFPWFFVISVIFCDLCDFLWFYVIFCDFYDFLWSLSLFVISMMFCDFS